MPLPKLEIELDVRYADSIIEIRDAQQVLFSGAFSTADAAAERARQVIYERLVNGGAAVRRSA